MITVGVVNHDVLSSIYNKDGLINKQYIKLDDDSQVRDVMENLSMKLPDYNIRESVSAETSNQDVSLISVVFNIVTMIILILGIFIIYFTFKTIALERLPVVGIFRSIGATKRITSLIFLGESIVYGIIGGAIGSVLGLGMLYIIANIIAPAWGHMVM